MRCFIAVDLDDKLIAAIKDLQSQLKGNKALSMIDENNLHFTLKFLGEINENQLAEVKELLKDIHSEKMTISLSGVGVFPSRSFIRVIWIGCNDRGFIDLHKTVHQKLSKFSKAEDPIPHLTIARARDTTTNIDNFIRNNENKVFGNMVVDKIILKKSILTKEGPIYEDIAIFGL